MGEMRDVTSRLGETEIKFQQAVTDNKIFSFDGYRREEQEQLGIWKKYTKGQQDTKYRPRCSDSWDIKPPERLSWASGSLVFANFRGSRG